MYTEGLWSQLGCLGMNNVSSYIFLCSLHTGFHGPFVFVYWVLKCCALLHDKVCAYHSVCVLSECVCAKRKCVCVRISEKVCVCVLSKCVCAKRKCVCVRISEKVPDV